nr:peptidase inhibitor 16-like [Oncorhynchus nerka]
MWEPNPDLELLNTGENLFVSNEPLDLNMTMEKWFLEHLDYDYNNNSCQEDRMCGHYTQMVWADSHSVGCAAHRCDTIEGLSFDKVNFLVCNYYPTGKFKDEKPYEEGEWCSKCPDNVPRCDQNLCVPDAPEPSEEPDVEEPDVEEPDAPAPSDEPDVEEPDAPDPSDEADVEEPDALEPSEEPDVEKETTESFTPHTATATEPGYEEEGDETGTQPGDEEDEEETGTEPGDEEEEEEWEGEERAAEREKERTRNQTPANAGRITTPLLLVTKIMALLSVGL